MNLLPAVAPFTLFLLVLVAFVAGMARGFSGFGAALIFVPLASALTDPKIAAPLLLIVDGVFASYLIPSAWSRAGRRDVGLMLIGAVGGIPLGAYVLTHFERLTLRWLVAASAAAMLALLLSGWRYHGRPHALATVATGAISGVFTGIAQIGGPTVVSYWLGAETKPAELRANIILFFAASSVLTLTSYFWGGLLSLEIVKIAPVAGPGYGLGVLGGSHMFGFASPAAFRAASLALIALAVAMSLPVFGR